MDAKQFKALNFYERMNVKQNFTAAELKKSLKSLSSKYHPDRNQDADAGAIMAMVNEANQTLSNPEKRAKYDHTLKQQAYKAEKAAQAAANKAREQAQAKQDAANKAAKQAQEAAKPQESAPKQEAPKSKTEEVHSGFDAFRQDFVWDDRFGQNGNTKIFAEWIKAKSRAEAETIRANGKIRTEEIKQGCEFQNPIASDFDNIGEEGAKSLCKTCHGKGILKVSIGYGKLGKKLCPACYGSGLK